MPRPERIFPSEKGKGRLLHQYKGKPKIEGVLDAFSFQFDDLEDAWFELLDERSLDTSIGQQLDNLGNIVGEPRDGRNDTDYRRAIQVRIRINNSSGTPEDLIDIAETATIGTDVRYFEHYPASYFISTDGTEIPNNIVQDFIDASPATVNIGIIHDKNNNTWIGSNEGEVDVSLIARASLGDIGESGARFLADIYTETGIVKTLDTFNISEVYSITQWVGTGGSIDIDVGLDISDNKALSIIKSVSGAADWSKVISPLLGVSKFRRLGQNTGSTRSLGVTAFSNTGFTLDQDVTLPATDRFNFALDNMVVNTFRAKEGFCDIVEWTGDGSLLRKLPHLCGKKPCFMLFFPKVNTGAVQHEVYWFKGMLGTEYISNSILTTNVSIWGSQLPTDTDFYVGFDGASVRNLNENGIDYMGILFADAPENGVTVEEYIADGVVGREITFPYNLGFSLVRGATQGSTGIFDVKSGSGRSRIVSGSSSGISPDLYYSVVKDKALLGSSAVTNGTSGTARYFNLIIKTPVTTPPDPDIIPNLNTIFSVDLYQGNESNNNVITSLDLLNNQGMMWQWRTDPSTGFMNHYNKAFDPYAIAQIGDKGYDRWTFNTSIYGNLGDFTLLNNGFSMVAGTSLEWNKNNTPFVVCSLLKTAGLVDIINYTGNGLGNQAILHTLNKPVAALMIMSLEKSSTSNVMMWIKGMPNNKALTHTTTVTAGAVWGGASPTDKQFTVGDIGGSFNLNSDGKPYIAYVFADDPESGFSAGTYNATGTEGQEIDILNRLGMLMIRNGNNGQGIFYTHKTGLSGKPLGAGATTSAYLNGIDIDNTKVRLGSSNSFTNSAGVPYYWLNIANPEQT